MAFKMTGAKEMDAVLRRLPTATAKSTVRRVSKRALEPVAQSARGMVPVQSGALQASIEVSGKLSKRQAKEARRLMSSGVSAAAVLTYVGSNSPVAHLVEFGTAPHKNGGKFKGSQHPGTAPQPFMRPAWDGNRQAVFDSLADDLRAEIDKVLGRMARRAAARAAKGA